MARSLHLPRAAGLDFLLLRQRRLGRLDKDFRMGLQAGADPFFPALDLEGHSLAALVRELIPALEAEFGGAGPEHRYVTGVSSGGWSSFWVSARTMGSSESR